MTDDGIVVDSYELLEDETIDEYVDQLLPKKFREYSKILVTGSMGLWHGRVEVYPIVLTDIYGSFASFSKFLSNDIERTRVIIHTKSYNVEAIHHDGTNYYKVMPFDFAMLKKKTLLNIIKEEDLKENINWYLDNYDTGYKVYNAPKGFLVDAINNHYDDFEDGGMMALKINSEDFTRKDLL